MKKLMLSFLAAFTLITARADEGMWLPYLIGKNIDEMQRMGLQLSAKDLYDVNNSSLKDAIVQFGGGCTGEMISGNGLLITNHHCGYGYIAGLSTVEKNYLDNGFWAKNIKEEIPAPGLSVIFLQRMEDVTEEVMNYIGDKTGKAYDEKLSEISKKIEKAASENGKYVADVKEFFNGNQIILLTYKKYTDVRLVGTPPKSLGKFGGDTDNWMWPRHTADFSLFRVYAGADNEPAAYSASNIPYVPKKYLPVSIKNEKEGEFAMVYGYPGRTNRYEVAAGVRQAIQEINPSIVNIREQRLAVMRKHMDADKSVYLKQTSLYQRISNYWKYFIGQTEQLKKNKVVAKKETQEARFYEWAQRNDKEDYKDLLNEYDEMYNAFQPYAKHSIYYREAFRAPVINRIAASMEKLAQAMERGVTDKDSLEKYTQTIADYRENVLKNADIATEKDIFKLMTKIYYTDVPKDQLPYIYEEIIFKKFSSSDIDITMENYTNHVFENTFLLDDDKMESFLENPTLKQLSNDPAYQHAVSFIRNYEENYQSKLEDYYKKKDALNKRYMKGLMEMYPYEHFYPDANSTMRLTYGRVLSYSPQDAVYFDYYTTVDGLMDKYKPGDAEFDVPQGFIDLYRKRDYGMYADKNGDLRACFITNNDITGGNSGSPVINGKGELMGLAFDGNWEAMSGDIDFDSKLKRTIVVDANLILFIIDKLGNAQNLIREMDVRK